MCRLLGISTSGYYAWCTRPRSARAIADEALLGRIREFHSRSRGTYGAPRTHADLVEEGWYVGRKRVARLMRLAGLRGVSRSRWVATTTRDTTARASPDLVERRFAVSGPNRVWDADVNHLTNCPGVQ